MTMAVGVRRRQFGCEYLGRLESVLVHTAAGGLGLAELQVARELGIPRRTFREKYLTQLREVFAAKDMDDYLR